MKTFFAITCIILSGTCTFAQNELGQASLLKRRGMECYNFFQYDSATYFYELAAVIFEKSGQTDSFLNCQVGIGQCLLKKGQYARGLEFFEKLQEKTKGKNKEKEVFAATCIHYRGYASIYLGKFEQAEKLINQSLEIRLRLLGKRHADLAQSYNLLGQYFFFKGDYRQALLHFNTSVQMNIGLFGEQSRELAQSLNNVSSAYYSLGMVDTAIYLANKSLNIKSLLLPANHPDFISTTNSLAVFYSEKRNYEGALHLHLRNLTLCKACYGEIHPVTGLVCNNIGYAYSKLGKLDSALKYYNQAIEIRSRINKGLNQDLALSLQAIGDVYDQSFDYQKAIAFKKQAVAILKNIFGETQNDYLANAYNSLAISLTNSGLTTESLHYSGMALSIFDEIYGHTNENSAMCLVNMGVAYGQAGEYGQSLSHYQKALAIYHEIKGEHSRESSIVYNNLAEIYLALENYEKSIEMATKSLNISKSVYGNESSEVALAYKNLGSNYEILGDYDRAIQNHELAIGICNKSIGEKHLTTAAVYESMSKLYYATANYEKSQGLSEQVLSIRKELLPVKHYLLSYTLNDLGMASFKRNQYNQALRYFTKSLENNLLGFTAGDNYFKAPPVKNYQDNMAFLNALKGKIIVFTSMYIENKLNSKERKQIQEAAIDHIDVCDKLIDKIRKSFLHEKDKLGFSSSSVAVYNLAINLCYMIYADTKEELFLDKTFYFSEKLKAGTLLEALAGSQAMKFSGVPDSILAKEKKLDRELAFLKKQLAESNAPDLQNRLFDNEKSKQNLINHCEQNYPKYFQLKYSEFVPDIKTLQASLDIHSALVSYYIDEQSVFQILITRDNIRVSRTDKLKDFDQKLEEFRQSIINGNSKSGLQTYAQLATELYDCLFQLKTDKTINSLVIIPYGNLATVPFEALLTRKIQENQKLNDYPYLIDRYTISYSYSANLHYLTRKKHMQEMPQITQLNDWLAFAPVFSDESISGLSLRNRGILKKISSGSDRLTSRGRLLTGDYVTPLPGTENEVKAIYKQYDSYGKSATVKLHQSANESFIKSSDLKQYRFLHFATHGFVDTERPELSGILLAQDTIGGNDGILFSGEMYNLELNADLVTLSACETGLGKLHSGEGLMGLTRALLFAGAKNIIVSLWQVSDDATTDLMIEFYAEMLKTDKQTNFSEYLRNAKLKMIKSKKFGHPFFWSPFILIGK
jgi:CHAT domain-containing protein